MTREEAIDVLKKNYPDSYFELLREAVDVAIEALKQPEQKKGKWIFSKSDGMTRCSACGQSDWRFFVPTVKEATRWMPICPKCGAKMKKEENNNDSSEY